MWSLECLHHGWGKINITRLESMGVVCKCLLMKSKNVDEVTFCSTVCCPCSTLRMCVCVHAWMHTLTHRWPFVPWSSHLLQCVRVTWSGCREILVHGFIRVSMCGGPVAAAPFLFVRPLPQGFTLKSLLRLRCSWAEEQASVDQC